MQLSYETQGSNTYLVYTVPQDIQLDMVSVGMLANNHIPGLAQTIFSQVDSTKYIKYNVSSKVPSEQMFISPINKRRFIGVINGIISAVLSAEEYMLEPDALLLDLRYMFSDIVTGETVLICVPTDEERDSHVDLKEFIKRIMYNTSFDQNENCDYIAKIINYLNSSASFVLPEFQEFLRSLGTKQVKAQNKKSEPQLSSVNVEKPQKTVPQNQANADLINTAPPAVPRGYQVSQEASLSPQQSRQDFNVPPALDDSTAQESSVDTGGKQMSLMYLLRHYSKENAAIYKAQHEQARDAEKNTVSSHASKENDKQSGKKEKVAKRGKNQPSASGFMVPGTSNGSQEARLEPSPAAALATNQVTASQAPVQQSAPAHVHTPPAQIHMQQSPFPQGTYEETWYNSPDLDEDQTMIRGVEGTPQSVMPYIIRKKNNERIPIDKDFFRLGRDVDFNDYAILDNRYVGHSHCHLSRQDGEYFIVDDNSKNHTSVNGKVIVPGQLVKLSHGYVISVADEEFEFRLY